MGMNQSNANDAAPGDYDCWAASSSVQIRTIQAGKNAGEVKAVVSVFADVGGTVETVEVWLTLDTRATTSKGKKRILFTADALAALGAVNALPEIGAALKADPSAASVQLTGLFGVDGKPTTLATLHVSQSGEYTNYDIWAKRKPVAASLGDELAAFGTKGATVQAPTINPFARPAPIAPPVAKSAEEPSFP